MKILIFTLLSLSLLSAQLHADDGDITPDTNKIYDGDITPDTNKIYDGDITPETTRVYDADINPDTARAYEGYLLTFIWPEKQSIEQVKYQDVLSIENLIRIEDTQDESSTFAFSDDQQTNQSITTENLSTPFTQFKERLDRHVEILSNQQWTLIFKQPGDTINKTFYSEKKKDGYPELTGDIAIKLGRYLESDILYKHYLFDSFTQPDIIKPSYSEPTIAETNITDPFLFPQPLNEPKEQAELKEFEPSFILTLNQSNRTASKKLNYLDHPIIGTLLYFEPITLEEAVEKIALQSMIPETGDSLDYDELNSTNELFKREETLETQETFTPPFVVE